ncbi:hypothetical protein BDZ88DRAFT_403234 [Geranomyces variabilis]|nr:hypothetical protein BDZ88DRAFT_403234 [Geranomyces variabilis]KAJ3141712.1 hypothetical protein HDU90_006055 [Geranomyces variabilis]
MAWSANMTTEEDVGGDRSPSPSGSSEPATSPPATIDFYYDGQNRGVSVNMDIESDNGLFGDTSDTEPVENMEQDEDANAEDDDDAAAAAGSGGDDGADTDESEAASESTPPSTASEESARFFQYMYSASESSSDAAESDAEIMDLDEVPDEQLQTHMAVAPAPSPPSLSDSDSDDMIIDQVFAALPVNHPRRTLYFKRKHQRRIARAKQRMNRPSISYKVSNSLARTRDLPQNPLVFPVFSDGESSLWPNTANNEMIDCEDGLQSKAEVVWLPKLGLAGNGFPVGYHLFGRPRPDGVTVDAYLYGHPSGKRFRSPAEFQPHLVWLAIGDPSIRCTCQHCDLMRPLSPERIKILRQRSGIKWALAPNGDADFETESESDLDIARAATEPPLELHIAAPPREASSSPLDTLTHEDRPELLATGVDRLIESPPNAVGTHSSTAVAPNVHTTDQQLVPPVITRKRRASRSPTPDLGSTVPSGPHQTPAMKLTRRCRPCFRFDSESPSHSLSRERNTTLHLIPALESTDAASVPELNPSSKHRRSPSLDEDVKELSQNVRKHARTVANGEGIEAQESFDIQATNERQSAFEENVASHNIGGLAQMGDTHENSNAEAGSRVNIKEDRVNLPSPSKVPDNELIRTESGVASPFPSVPASTASVSGDEMDTVYESDGCKANTDGLAAENAESAASSPEASEAESSSDEDEDEDDNDEYKIYIPRAGEIVWCLTARMNQTPLTSGPPGRSINPQYWPSVVISERVAEIAFPVLVKRHGKQRAPARGPRPGVWVEPLGLGALVPAADGSGVPIRPRTPGAPIPANAACDPTWIECRRLRTKQGQLRANPCLIPFHAMLPQRIVPPPGTLGMVEYDRALIQATGIATTVETFTSDNSLTFEGFQGEARPTSPESDASTADTFLAAVRLGADVLRVKDLVAVADRKTQAFVEPEHVVCIEALEKNRGNIFVIGNRLIPVRKRKRGRGRAKKGSNDDQDDDDSEQFWKFRAHHVLGRVQVATALGMNGWPTHPGIYGRGKGAESRGVWEGWVEAADILD